MQLRLAPCRVELICVPQIRRFAEGQETRVSAMVGLLHSAIVAAPSANEEPLPAIDSEAHAALPQQLAGSSLFGAVVIGLGDFGGLNPNEGTWALTRAPTDGPAKVWMLPDFGFAAWTEAGTPSYEEYRRLAADVERATPWEKKDDRAVSVRHGNRLAHSSRYFAVLARLPKRVGTVEPCRYSSADAQNRSYELRNDLMNRTDATADPQRAMWSDVVATGGGSSVPTVRTWKHCERKYLIHTEGNSYSGCVTLGRVRRSGGSVVSSQVAPCSRSKYLFGCRSVVIAHKVSLAWPLPPGNGAQLVCSPGGHSTSIRRSSPTRARRTKTTSS